MGQVVDFWNFLAQTAFEGIPVLLSTSVGVREAAFTIHYDPLLLAIDAAKLGPTIAVGTTLNFTIPAPGTIQVSVSNQTADLSPDTSTFALVSLMRADVGNPGQFLSPLVPATASYGGVHVIDIENLQVWGPGDAPITTIANNGIHIAAYAGDLSGNQSYNSPDVSFAQQFILNQATFGLGAYPLTDPVILADINANGSVQANDTVQIQRLTLNLDIPFVPARPVSPEVPIDKIALGAGSRSPTGNAFAFDLLNAEGSDLVIDLSADEGATEDSVALQALWASLANGKPEESFDLDFDFIVTDDTSSGDGANAVWLLSFLAPDHS
jgi:hypothetical protein